MVQQHFHFGKFMNQDQNESFIVDGRHYCLECWINSGGNSPSRPCQPVFAAYGMASCFQCVSVLSFHLITLGITLICIQRVNCEGLFEWPFLCNVPQIAHDPLPSLTRCAVDYVRAHEYALGKCVDEYCRHWAFFFIVSLAGFPQFNGRTFQIKIPLVPRFIAICNPDCVEHILKTNFSVSGLLPVLLVTECRQERPCRIMSKAHILMKFFMKCLEMVGTTFAFSKFMTHTTNSSFHSH